MIMAMWTQAQLTQFSKLDDFKVSVYHPDMKTTGTLTYIWSVVAQNNLYIRGGYGQKSRWFQAAKAQRAGIIMIGGKQYRVNFDYVPVTGNESLLNSIDAAYHAKYDSKSLSSTKSMTEKRPNGPRTATIKVTPMN